MLLCYLERQDALKNALATLQMRGIKKCPTIIYRLKKYRNTGIPRYFVMSSIVGNLVQKFNPKNHLQCSRRFSLPYVNFLPPDVAVTLLAFMLEF